MKFTARAIMIILIISSPMLGICETPGYFKDIFSDGGVRLTSGQYLLAAVNAGFSVEYLATEDVEFQNQVMIGDSIDTNGHLLYPDGSPRFRMIFTRGGSASHGDSLGEPGRRRVRSFYERGGSYAGSCAGAFLASLHWDTTGINPMYYHIWPGRTQETFRGNFMTGNFITPGSALLNYNSFGDDHYISNVSHEWGCYANETVDYPPETEVLARYDVPGYDMHEKASVWAYKVSDARGRIVLTGSHPELAFFGDPLELMEAMLMYAIDGVGEPSIKAELENGAPRVMDLSTEDDSPAYTRIGDRQYHHFTIELPADVQDLQVELTAEDGYDFRLYAQPGDFAFEDAGEYSSGTTGSQHILNISPQVSGLWFIGVECVTSVDDSMAVYSGQLEVLNGVAYSISASWNTTAIDQQAESSARPLEFKLFPNSPNPFNPSTTISYSLSEAQVVTLTIYDVSGRQVTQLVSEFQNVGQHQIIWNAQEPSGRAFPAGVYFVQLETAAGTRSIKLSLVK